MNYLGGQLHYFSQFVAAGGTIDLGKLKEDPIAILRLMLEMDYVLSCWFHRSASLSNRNMPKVIEEVGDLTSSIAGSSLLQGDFAGLLGTLASEMKQGTFLSSIAVENDINPPANENTPYHLWISWALQKGMRGEGWFPFFYYIFWWQVYELVEPSRENVAIKVGKKDRVEFFRTIFSDQRFGPALARVGQVSSVLCQFFRSSGVYVRPDYPDYLPPGADLATVIEVAKVQARARLDALRAVIGGKARDRNVMPRRVMEALSHLVSSNHNMYLDETGKRRWFPVDYSLEAQIPEQANNRTWVRVPGGKKARTLEEKKASNDYINIDKYVWYTVSGRLNERGANFYINMGDAMRTRFQASRGVLADSKTGAQAREFRRTRKNLSPLRDRGDDAAGQSWGKEQENQENFKILCEQFNERRNFPEFASWVFNKSVRGAPRFALKGLRPDEQETAGNQLRNRFDMLAKTGLGKQVNRKGLPGMLDKLHAKLLGLYSQGSGVDSDIGRFVNDKLDHFRKRGLFPFLDPRLYKAPPLPVVEPEPPSPGSGVIQPALEKASEGTLPAYTSWIRDELRAFDFLYGWEMDFAQVLLKDLLDDSAPKAMKEYFVKTRQGKKAQGKKEKGGAPAPGSVISPPSVNDIIGVFKELEEVYPPILRVAPLFDPSKEEDEAKSGKTQSSPSEVTHEVLPCLEELVLAILRSLALHHEKDSLESGRKSDKGPKGNAIRVKLLRMAYAQEYLTENMRDPEFRDDFSSEVLWGEGRLSYRGMAAALAISFLPPQRSLMKRYAGTISDLFKDHPSSLAAISPDALEAEDAFTKGLWKGNVIKFSSPLIADFYIAGHWLYHAIGTIAAFAPAGGNLGDFRRKLLKFIDRADTAWVKRGKILLKADWADEGTAQHVARDIITIEDPFESLDLGVALSPPSKESFKHTPLPVFLRLGMGSFATPITPDGNSVGDFDALIANIAAGQDSILYKVDCPPLLPSDALITRRKYLPEAGLEVHDLIGRVRTARKEKDWEDRHNSILDEIDLAEDTAEWLRSVEEEGKDLFVVLSFADARLNAIWAGINDLLHRDGPFEVQALGGEKEGQKGRDEGGAEEEFKEGSAEQLGAALDRISDAIQEVWQGYPLLGSVAKNVLLSFPVSAGEYGVLTPGERDMLTGLYSSFIKDALSAKKSKRDELVKAWAVGSTNGFFELMDEMLEGVPADKFHSNEYWGGRIIARARRKGIIAGAEPPVAQFNAYIFSYMDLLNLGSRFRKALPGLVHVSLFHKAVESLRNWLNGKEPSKAGDFAGSFHTLQDQVDKGVTYRQDAQFWDSEAATIVAGIPGFSDFLETWAVAAAPLAPPGTGAFPRVLKDVFSVASARDLMGAIDREIKRLGWDTRDNYRVLNYYRSRQHEVDSRSAKDSRRAREVTSTAQYGNKEDSRAKWKREFNRKSLKAAWRAAMGVKEFKEYYLGAGALHEVRLPRTLLKFIRENAGEDRVGIAGINLLPPSYPAKHATVALGILTSRKAAEGRRPEFVASFKSLNVTPKGEVVVGFDINQWNCRRTFAVNVVFEKDGGFKFLLSKDPSSPSKQPVFPVEVNRAIQGIPPHAWEKFFERVKRKVMRAQGRNKLSPGIDFPFPLATPTPEHPYHLEAAGKNVLDFNDEYSGVEYYRAVHSSHESRKAEAVRHKRRNLRKQARDETERNGKQFPKRGPEAPAGRPRAGRSSERLEGLDGARMRRLGQAELLEARATSLRACSLEKQARKVAYCAVAFDARAVVSERLTFFAKGIPGPMGKIRLLMPKDFRDAWTRAEALLRVHGTGAPEFIQVGAPKTSQMCTIHGNDGGRADDRFSHDLWRCTKGEEIVDGHVNAGGQISLSGILKSRGDEGEEDEGGG